MSDQSVAERLILDVPGLTNDTLLVIRRAWHRDNEMRKIIRKLAEYSVETERNALESCNSEELPHIQGRIAGIKKLLGAIEAQGLS